MSFVNGSFYQNNHLPKSENLSHDWIPFSLQLSYGIFDGLLIDDLALAKNLVILHARQKLQLIRNRIEREKKNSKNP